MSWFHFAPYTGTRARTHPVNAGKILLSEAPDDGPGLLQLTSPSSRPLYKYSLSRLMMSGGGPHCSVSLALSDFGGGTGGGAELARCAAGAGAGDGGLDEALGAASVAACSGTMRMREAPCDDRTRADEQDTGRALPVACADMDDGRTSSTGCREASIPSPVLTLESTRRTFARSLNLSAIFDGKRNGCSFPSRNVYNFNIV